VGNMLGEYHVPFTLMSSFVNFGKRVGTLKPLKTKCFVSTELSIVFQSQSKVVDPSISSFPYIIYILFNLFST